MRVFITDRERQVWLQKNPAHVYFGYYQLFNWQEAYQHTWSGCSMLVELSVIYKSLPATHPDRRGDFALPQNISLDSSLS